METSITIDDDVLEVARALADREDTNLGTALSQLARRGFRSAITDRDGGMPVFGVPDDAPLITCENVLRELDEWK